MPVAYLGYGNLWYAGLNVINIAVIILTFNSEATIGSTLESVTQITNEIHVVDSFSSDHTLEIAKAYGTHSIQHEFLNYSAQRNWAIDNLPIKSDWQLHLDADERLSDGLVAELKDLVPHAEVNGYYLARLTHFLGRPIYHGGMYPIWQMRLFRNGTGRCENRRYDQHFLVSGKAQRLSHPLIDDHRMTIAEWTARHNRWADSEVNELANPGREGIIEPNLLGNPIEKKRALKAGYYHLPLFVRAFLLFLYRYILRMGFLDGKEGLIYFVLQTFWFRFLVDAKLFEKEHLDGKNSKV
jgi:glycosyltransferase involved in cell wall biosynthesis